MALRAFLGRVTGRELDAFEAEEFWVETATRSVNVSTDGEVTVMDAPLHYRIRPGCSALSRRRGTASGLKRPLEVAPSRSNQTAALLCGRRTETVHAAEVVGIDNLALAIDDQFSAQSQINRRAANLSQMRAPGEFIFAALCRVGLGCVRRADRPASRPLRAKASDDDFEG